MKRFAVLIALFYSAVSFGATTVPVQLLNSAGSSVGQAIVSTGVSSAPAWGGVGVNGIAALAANTVLANATGSSASPTAFSMPSCSATGNALNWTSGTGFTCQTSLATLASPALTGTPTAPTATAGTNTTQIATTAFVANSFAPLASPTFTGTATVANLAATGTITGVNGRLLNIQTFTSSGSYTPTSGANRALVCGVGGGGAGGGAPATGAAQASIGGGGSAGAFGCIYVASGLASQTVAIGAAGTGVSGANGGSGGQTSFGALMTLPGGPGGGTAGPTAGPAVAFSTAQSSAPGGTGSYVYSSKGAYANLGVIATATSFASGTGANSSYGAGGPNQAGSTSAGAGASGYGAGGGGAGALASQSAQTGGAGTAGIVVVYEYQ